VQFDQAGKDRAASLDTARPRNPRSGLCTVLDRYNNPFFDIDNRVGITSNALFIVTSGRPATFSVGKRVQSGLSFAGAALSRGREGIPGRQWKHVRLCVME